MPGVFLPYYFKYNGLVRRHDTQHNDIQHNNTHHNDTQHKGLLSDIQHNSTQHNDTLLNVIVLNVAIYLLLC